MKNNTFIYTIVLLYFFLINSCTAPLSKEEYLKDYEEFIETVSKDCKTYDENDWKKKDEKFDKFNREWYDKFKEEFTWKDELVLGKNSVQYNMYRAKNDVKGFLESLFGTNDEIEEKVKHYVENDLEEDLEDLINEAKEISDSAEIFINDLIKKYKK